MGETGGISAERLAAVREALRHIVTAPGLGQAALSDPRRMSNLLTDLLPGAVLEKTVLVAAADNRVAERIGDLIAAGVPARAAVQMSAQSLAACTGFTAESCAWGTREIAMAIGVRPGPGEFRAPAPEVSVPPVMSSLVTGLSGPPAVSVSGAAMVPPATRPLAWSAAPLPPATRAAGSGKSLRIWAAGAVAVVVAALAVVLVVRFTPHVRPRPVLAVPSVHVYSVTSGPNAVALAGAHAWVSQVQPDGVAEFNFGDGTQAARYSAGLRAPWDIAAGGGYVWVANGSTPGSVTKLNAATGKVIQVFGSSSGIVNPTAVAIQGSTVWVANLGATASDGNFSGFGSVTELDARTGARLRTIRGSEGKITYPVSIAVSGPYVWILDSGYKEGLGGVTRIDTRNGRGWTKTGGIYGFERPASIAVSGSHVWVLNNPYRGSLSVIEMNASDGSWVRTLSGPQYDFGRFVKHLAYRPEGIAAAGSRVWVANPLGGSGGHGSLTEINAQTGGLVRVLSGSPYHFYLPIAVAGAGPQVWIASFGPRNKPGRLTVLRSFR